MAKMHVTVAKAVRVPVSMAVGVCDGPQTELPTINLLSKVKYT